MAVDFSSEVTLSESGFLFDHASGQTYTLNATGQFILRRLQEGGDRDTVLPDVMNAFDVPENTARNDIDDFFRQLRELGLVR